MSYKILIIEDDHATIQTIELAFELYWSEASVIHTDLGEEGINLTKTQQIDAIILDLGLPDISGFEVLKQIRLFSNIPIIILTAMLGEDKAVKALEEDATDFVAKPFRPRELVARLQSHIAIWKTNEIRSIIPDKNKPENNLN